MATYRKRGNSYQIRVSCGYDTSGKQVIQTMSWKPTIGMKDKQIEKELSRIRLFSLKKNAKAVRSHPTSSFKALLNNGLKNMQYAIFVVTPMRV